VDYGAVVRLNGEPVFIARAGNEVSGSITPIAGNNELTIEFEVAFSSDRGSYGYRVEVDGHVLLQGQCSLGCLAAPVYLLGQPTPYGTAQKNRPLQKATLHFVSYQVSGALPLAGLSQSATPWANAAAVLLSWQEGRVVSGAAAAIRAGPRFGALLKSRSPLDNSAIEPFARGLKFAQLPSAQASLQETLSSRGPIWAPAAGTVLFAIAGDGTPAKTYASLIDLTSGVQTSELLADFQLRNGSGLLFVSGSRPARK